MTTELIIIQFFCAVDDRLGAMPKEANASWYPSEIVTIGILFSFKGAAFGLATASCGGLPSAVWRLARPGLSEQAAPPRQPEAVFQRHLERADAH